MAKSKKKAKKSKPKTESIDVIPFGNRVLIEMILDDKIEGTDLVMPTAKTDSGYIRAIGCTVEPMMVNHSPQGEYSADGMNHTDARRCFSRGLSIGDKVYVATGLKQGDKFQRDVDGETKLFLVVPPDRISAILEK